ncbi:Ran-binding protein 9 [Geodia barretti]|uniref:Ran-binding protein 9 n=1 Tax=Geodia barretti TaxID=519541 RepID=A0AA35SZU1_GEOBA|nr:Ran-binding protein 9 [Geodia barretti]
MGIGLSTSGVNLNRLPGWEKQSYGYHADDGCVFSSSGTGQAYGPTFTTGDTVGCGFNLVERSIFYTKNGINIGTAVSEVPVSCPLQLFSLISPLQSLSCLTSPSLVQPSLSLSLSPQSSLHLYPTVGLQTPGEIVEANFGESPFVFDFEGLLSDVQQQIRQSIEATPVSDGIGSWQTRLNKLVLSYLVHHGYCRTAQVFASSTGQRLEEDMTSIRNRQRIQKLVMAGRVSEAVGVVQASYPGLLETNEELLFRLKCRQFVEMIAGCDRADAPPSPTTASSSREPRLSCHSELSVSSGEVGEEEGRGGGGGESPYSNGEVMTNGEEADMEVDGDEGEEEKERMIEEEEEVIDVERNPVAIEKILAFGRDLQTLHTRVSSGHSNDHLKTLLQDSFSLLAYMEPRSSPVGYLLDPMQREPVCAALNSAILESKNLPGPATARVCPRTGSPVSQTHVTERTGVSSIHWRPGHCVILTSSHLLICHAPSLSHSTPSHTLRAREISPHLKLCCHFTTLVPTVYEIDAQKTCFMCAIS